MGQPPRNLLLATPEKDTNHINQTNQTNTRQHPSNGNLHKRQGHKKTTQTTTTAEKGRTNPHPLLTNPTNRQRKGIEQNQQATRK